MINSIQKTAKVPDKYNGNQLDQLKKYGLFMDYLVLNYVGSPVFDFEGIQADYADYGTKVFEKRVSLTYKGELFGTLTFQPRSAIIDSELCQLKLENHLFYTRPLEAIKNQLEEVTELMGLSFKNFNRLDVALDFQEDTHNVNDLLRSICANEVLISGREKDINIYSQTKKGKMSFQGIRIGARTSSRFLRIYNKTLESKKVLKTYINEAWLSLGFDSTEVNPVWRYEYQLSSKYLRDVEGLTLDVVFSNDGLFNLLKAANTNHFDLKHNTNKSEVNKERTYSFLCWSAVSASVGVVFKVLKKLKRTIKETLIGQQRMAKSLLRSYFSTGQRLEYILPLKLMLNDFDLWQWFGTKLPFYIDEFKKAQLFKTLDMSQLRNDLQYQIWEYEN